jgi:hypothetical protein
MGGGVTIFETTLYFPATLQVLRGEYIAESNDFCGIIIIISCHRFYFFPGTSLEPVVNPTTQASSLSL